MSKSQVRLRSGMLNAGLIILGLIALVFLYALVARFVLPRVDPVREDNPTSLVGDIIQIEVRNGCGVAGVAATTTQFLRRHGFDVVEVGNYTTSNVQHTQVVDRVGNLEAARKVAAILGIPEDRVRQDIKMEYFLDATIIIGQDYTSLPPFQEEE